MREVPKDDMWAATQEEAHDATVENRAGSRPSETELVIISLLMRLYDLNLAILNHFDEARANEIYAAHEKGGTFNPAIFIPEVKS